MDAKKKKDVLRPVDADALALATRLLRQSGDGTLATLSAEDGHPLASRVSLCADMGGTPLILISELSEHTGALFKDGRCSLLVGEMGDGDPLAYPRMTLVCEAEQRDRNHSRHAYIRQRFLNRHPRAELYVDFDDFHFFALSITRASLNGGFGKAYALSTSDLVLENQSLLSDLEHNEAGILEHMNDDHAEAIAHYAKSAGQIDEQAWRMIGLDYQGMDLASPSTCLRVPFPEDLTKVDDVRRILVTMAKR